MKKWIMVLFMVLLLAFGNKVEAVDVDDADLNVLYEGYLGADDTIGSDTYMFDIPKDVKITVELTFEPSEDSPCDYVYIGADNNWEMTDDDEKDLRKDYLDEHICISDGKVKKTFFAYKGELCLFLENIDEDENISKCAYTLKVYMSQTDAKSIKMPKSMTVYKGTKKKISITKIKPAKSDLSNAKWSSSNKKIAKVDKKGYVKGVKVGKCTITCKLKNGKKYKCKITVKQKPAITIERAYFSIDSAGGVEPYIEITNNVNKKIKYIYLDTRFYNTVGDPAYCDIQRKYKYTLKIVGPIKAKAKAKDFEWNPVMYNYNTGYMKIVSAQIVYYGGATKTISINKKYKGND